MKSFTLLPLPAWGVIALLALTLHRARAADTGEELVPPRPRPNVEELREKFRSLNPEQRQNLLREFRERRGPAATNRSEWEVLREELRKLPPQEREARLRELRRRLDETPPQFRVLTAEEREAKRKQMQERVAAQVSFLRAKKAESGLTDVEQRRLERMEQMSGKLASGAVLGTRRPSPTAGLPPPRRSVPSTPAEGGTPNTNSNPNQAKSPP